MSGTPTAQLIAEFLPIALGSNVLPITDLSYQAGVEREAWRPAPAHLWGSLLRVTKYQPTVRFRTPIAMAYAAIGNLTFAEFTTCKLGLLTYKTAIADRALKVLEMASGVNAHASIGRITKDRGLILAEVTLRFRADDGQTLPFGDPATGTIGDFAIGTPALALHTAGPVVISDDTATPVVGALWGVSEIDIDIANTFEVMTPDGALVPTLVAHTMGAPKATLTADDAVTALTKVNARGQGGAGTTHTVFFRKYGTTTDTVLGTGGFSIAITGRLTPESLDGSVGQIAKQRLVIEGLSADPTTGPLTVSTNATIPTTSSLYA